MCARLLFSPAALPSPLAFGPSIHHRSTDPLTGSTAGAPPGPEGAPGNPGSLAIGAGWNLPSSEQSYGEVTSQSPSYDPSR